jgi:hypothetical protein
MMLKAFFNACLICEGPAPQTNPPSNDLET